MEWKLTIVIVENVIAASIGDDTLTAWSVDISMGTHDDCATTRPHVFATLVEEGTGDALGATDENLVSGRQGLACKAWVR